MMDEKLQRRARELRKLNTAAERYLWYLLKNRQLYKYKFRRQYIITPYIVDFICLSKKLIIELDGGQHADCVQYDERRTKYLEAKGYRVLRFWNAAVFKETQSVIETILDALIFPHPSP